MALPPLGPPRHHVIKQTIAIKIDELTRLELARTVITQVRHVGRRLIHPVTRPPVVLTVRPEVERDRRQTAPLASTLLQTDQPRIARVRTILITESVVTGGLIFSLNRHRLQAKVMLIMTTDSVFHTLVCAPLVDKLNTHIRTDTLGIIAAQVNLLDQASLMIDRAIGDAIGIA